MFENRVLGRISGPKSEEMAGYWTGLHNDELHDLYSSTNIIRVIKSKRVRCVKHVARMGELRNAYNNLVEKPEGK
jgi:hypothetical protein